MTVAFRRVADSSCQLCSAHFFQLKTLYEELSYVGRGLGLWAAVTQASQEPAQRMTDSSLSHVCEILLCF